MSMMKRFGTALLACALSVTVAPAFATADIGHDHDGDALSVNTAPASATEGSALLRVCADPGNMPLSNNKGEGFQNKIAEILAQAMGAQLTYYYRPYLERGLTSQTVDADACDILMDMSPNDDRLLTTRPVYRSAFVLVYRNDKGYAFNGLDDPRLLNDLTVGVFQHSAARQVLQERGLTRGNTVVHPISYNADVKPERQPSRQVQQVINGRLDVAAIWGPMAGWYKAVKGAPVTIQPMNLMDDTTPLEFEVSIGMRKGAEALKTRIEQTMMREKTRIRRILEEYGVPLVECERCIVSGDLPSHGPYKAPARVAADLAQTEPSEAQLTRDIDAALAGGETVDSELHNAILANDPTRVRYLIARGADVNGRDAQNQTPLMMAVMHGHEPVVALLLNCKADPNLADKDGWTALMRAVQRNDPTMVRLLAAHGADLEVVNRTGMTALAMAALHGKSLAAAALLESGAKVDGAIGTARYTPLMISMFSGAQPVAQALLRYGAQVNASNSGGLTALMIAAASNRSEMVALLLGAGADAALKDDAGRTALALARERDAAAVVSLLTGRSAVGGAASAAQERGLY
jgi:quinoprotein dehydrogenase-associated probable ABC transporter substrate-binding protein